MKNWLQRPQSSIVTEFVECYWMIERTSESKGHQFPKLNPDPSAHLIISPTEHEYSYEIEGTFNRGNGCHWLFPHNKTHQLDHTHAFIHLGIKFRVGALYSLETPNYSHPMLDLVAEVNPIELLGSSQIQELLPLARRNSEQCCKQLDDILAPWLKRSKRDRHSELVKKVLPFIDDTAIAKLGDRLFCSQRTLERSFSRVTGLTLKQCQSMNKLEAMLEHLYQLNSRDIDWAEVALKFGFSDQPHLIRYLKNQLGLTPNMYANERGLTIDVYGGIGDL